MCSLFIAPRSSSFIPSSLLLSLCLGPPVLWEQRTVHPPMEDRVCLGWSRDADKESCGDMACGHSSRRVMQREWNTSSSAGVRLECAAARRDDSGDTETSPEMCIRQTKRWRDKIGQPRQKREGRSRAEIVRVRNNLFSLCAWLVGVLYLTPSPNTASPCRQTERRTSRLCWDLRGRFSQPKSLFKCLLVWVNVKLPALPFCCEFWTLCHLFLLKSLIYITAGLQRLIIFISDYIGAHFQD